MVRVGDLVQGIPRSPVQVFDGYPGYWCGLVMFFDRDPSYGKYNRLHVLIGDEIKKSWLTDDQLIQNVEVLR